MDENQLDRLSDDLLRLIFNKVIDAKSLCRCLSVSKRFSSLTRQTNSVSLQIPLLTQTPPINPESKQNSFTNLITKLITKPLQFLHRIISPSSNSNSHYSPNQLLKSFNEIHDLRVQLPDCPRGELPLDDNKFFLKWNAAFGKQLKSCVILGAKSINGKDVINEESLIYNEELQLRVVWTISCLIAASARHYLIKQVILDRPMVKRVEITDEKNQGRVIMTDDDVAELRNDGVRLEEEGERSRVPALRMKMWYVPRLKLPVTGRVVEGATLVLIRAVDEKGCECDDELLDSAFDGEEETEVVKEMVNKKKKMYTTLEIDSF